MYFEIGDSPISEFSGLISSVMHVCFYQYGQSVCNFDSGTKRKNK